MNFLFLNRFLGSRAVAVLNHWFQLNREYPYPDDERTDQLANEAGITQKQVKKWFANKRVRSQLCYKPLYRSRKVKSHFNTRIFFKRILYYLDT